MLTQKSCFAVLQTRTLHCFLHKSSTTIFQHWCKDLASEHMWNLMTISIHSCKQQPVICLGCYCIIQPTLVVVKERWLRSCKDLHRSGLTIYIKSCSHKLLSQLEYQTEMRKLPYCSSGIQQQVAINTSLHTCQQIQVEARKCFQHVWKQWQNFLPSKYCTVHKQTMLKHRLLAFYAEKLSQSEWNIKTCTSMVCGTPGYVASKFLSGEMGPKCDVFSFGVVRAGGKVCTCTPDQGFDCMYICRSSLKHTASWKHTMQEETSQCWYVLLTMKLKNNSLL